MFLLHFREYKLNKLLCTFLCLLECWELFNKLIKKYGLSIMRVLRQLKLLMMMRLSVFIKGSIRRWFWELLLLLKRNNLLVRLWMIFIYFLFTWNKYTRILLIIRDLTSYRLWFFSIRTLRLTDTIQWLVEIKKFWVLFCHVVIVFVLVLLFYDNKQSTVFSWLLLWTLIIMTMSITTICYKLGNKIMMKIVDIDKKLQNHR